MDPEAVEEDVSPDRPSSSTASARFDSIYERHYREILAFCRRRVSSAQVDDAVAETFLTAWRRIDDVPDGDAALLWLYRVAYRNVGRQWRTRDRRRRLTGRLAAVRNEAVPGPDERVADDDDLRRVVAATERLNKTDAEILLLLCWEHLSHDEIADVLDLAPNAVRQRLHRARKNLSKEYERLERRNTDRTPVARKGGMS